MPTYQALQLQIEQLQAQAQEARKRELTSVIAEIKQKIIDYDLSLSDLGFTNSKPSRAGAKAPQPPKYKNPRTGQTWSGRGKPPHWIAGKNKDKFLI
ncbi:MAG: DNA-binding protein H-NS [Glomeribacter sp. 1016415]|uniref:Histone family protein nucleoid-structuring protein H-NS n=1 Tax=Mycoavidus cysteinexigens TaxID=1553431 RepID=A0A2Z6EY33_9BURK|nr:H-NS histone family protein [Mycoavidus cysteinexigens]MCX8566224.1 DNA-binding protein H-NS [Glomeribacter sp. 1016415]BBE10351.1 Histone family protein nucleoid-structuring protein H-NS [Mycoavidus cysteinexigens]GAM53276.1 DNA-binding protein H-NS [bacterium endosymbiont of Mortierella elongata FMR23-6]GLR00768.1 H-NS histone [Mycoavidus cysteinexigens]